MDRDQQWFQQDGATPHTSEVSLAWLREDLMTDWSAGGVMLSGQRIHQTWTPRFLSVGVSQRQCVWEQSSNNRWTEGSNQRNDQANTQGGMCESHWQFCATCGASVPSTPRTTFYFKEHKNYANWLRWLKLCGHIIHTLKYKSTKFEEIWWTYVELMKLFMGSVFFFGHPVLIVFWALRKHETVSYLNS